MKKLIILIALMQSAVVSGQDNSSCENRFRTHCYSLEQHEPLNFPQAEQACVTKYGGHLTSIHGAEENDYISNLVDPAGQGEITALIGGVAPRGFTSGQGGQYRWSDGTPWVFSGWRTRTSEPNGTPSDKPAAIQFWPNTNGRLSGWNDVSRYDVFEYSVCKYRLQEYENTSPYKLYGNRRFAGFPWHDPENGVLTLTPVDAFSSSGVAILREPATVPFDLSFEFSIWDDDGGREDRKRWNSADGISVILLADDSAYEEMAPPAGSETGFFSDGSSIRIFFKTYGDRQVVLEDGYRILMQKPEPGIYTGGTWQKIRIGVTSDSISVYFDDRLALFWEGAVPLAAPKIAFGAGTGGANGRHQVRNVAVTPQAMP